MPQTEAVRRILHVVGARPNFMKMAPIVHEMARYPGEFEQILVHAGQHYDANMSQVFCEELELPRPDVNLEAGPGRMPGRRRKSCCALSRLC